MDDETSRLVDRWIITFLEPPAFVDAELMARVLAEEDDRIAGQQSQ